MWAGVLPTDLDWVSLCFSASLLQSALLTLGKQPDCVPGSFGMRMEDGGYTKDCLAATHLGLLGKISLMGKVIFHKYRL